MSVPEVVSSAVAMSILNSPISFLIGVTVSLLASCCSNLGVNMQAAALASRRESNRRALEESEVLFPPEESSLEDSQSSLLELPTPHAGYADHSPGSFNPEPSTSSATQLSDTSAYPAPADDDGNDNINGRLKLRSPDRSAGTHSHHSVNPSHLSPHFRSSSSDSIVSLSSSIDGAPVSTLRVGTDLSKPTAGWRYLCSPEFFAEWKWYLGK
ncbi:uncharacterized protein BJ171DRAFT_175045 [Polychytrium aggregatum]|uniref:uncharacterized protein n=1 Tax=Polychytrium aggregatum TaxID=110093 RepID=UPI0022FF0038|nr:uncharacterized protein BJ171DRAFT_175045 [Polychytrium aggregatum]KAI9209084.1 hypothetical protein BJ171DRAFT_175045 [Polychytrium aggregatum]